MGGMPLGRRVGKTKEGCELRESHLLYKAVFNAKKGDIGGKNLFIAIFGSKIKRALGLFDGCAFSGLWDLFQDYYQVFYISTLYGAMQIELTD